MVLKTCQTVPTQKNIKLGKNHSVHLLKLKQKHTSSANKKYNTWNKAALHFRVVPHGS